MRSYRISGLQYLKHLEIVVVSKVTRKGYEVSKRPLGSEMTLQFREIHTHDKKKEAGEHLD